MYVNDANDGVEKIVYKKLSFKLNGLFYQIHNQLGRYRNEKQYADALEEILKQNRIKHLREKPLPRSFKGEKSSRNIPDFLIQNKIIVDLKAKRIITKNDYFQMRRYLVSGNKKLGIIVNFRQKYLTPKRVLNSNYLPHS